MAISYSAARWVAPISFLVDFAAQSYGILSTPNMKNIHDANLSFWSPHPYFVAGFFFPQQIFQLVWLYRLWKLDSKKQVVEQGEVEKMLDFVPYYVVGNICLAAWMIFWNASALKTANVFVLINSFTQLYYVFGRLQPLNTSSKSSVLTHIVSKTFAGLAVLDFLHNGSVAYFDHQGPSTVVKVLTGVGFAALATVSDWIFGSCLVYDLIALAAGQRSIGEVGWGNVLGIYAVGAAGVVVVKNLIRPQGSQNDSTGYDEASTEDVE